jgi:hypothetical protein
MATISYHFFSSVDTVVHYMTHNPNITGLNPAAGTRIKKIKKTNDLAIGSSTVVEHLKNYPEIMGLNPITGTGR